MHQSWPPGTNYGLDVLGAGTRDESRGTEEQGQEKQGTRRIKDQVSLGKDIQSYRDLIVWQKAHQLAKKVLNITRQFPGTDEARIVKKQLIRAILSVPANIAEGYGGNTGAAYRNYLVIARRSLTESDYWLFLSLDVGYVNDSLYKEAIDLANETRAILTTIINKLGKTKAVK